MIEEAEHTDDQQSVEMMEGTDTTENLQEIQTGTHKFLSNG